MTDITYDQLKNISGEWPRPTREICHTSPQALDPPSPPIWIYKEGITVLGTYQEYIADIKLQRQHQETGDPQNLQSGGWTTSLSDNGNGAKNPYQPIYHILGLDANTVLQTDLKINKSHFKNLKNSAVTGRLKDYQIHIFSGKFGHSWEFTRIPDLPHLWEAPYNIRSDLIRVNP